MSDARPTDGGKGHALFTDLYELTMLQAYWTEDRLQPAVFSLYFRRLPQARNYTLACGLDSVLHYLENLRFSEGDIAQLRTLELFSDDFLQWLLGFRFTGDVYAPAEGTPVFPNEPLLEVVAPLPEAQLAESFAMNQMHLQTVLATKASRVVEAAQGRRVVDFGMRRMHGADAALQGVRAFYVGGVHATSNVLGGLLHGVPVAGTMAHSYIQVHDSEAAAFRCFSDLYPQTILLVDTYDSIEGVRKVVELASERGAAFQIRGIRLDSGDLAQLAHEARKVLDEAGLEQLQIFASGDLDEYRIEEIVRSGAPIDAFGVGTRLGVSRDEPSLDLAYKLTEYDGAGRLKTSPNKLTLPGRKQVFRMEENGRTVGDVIGRHDEPLAGRPLLEPVMRNGERLPAGRRTLREARERAADELARLPDRVRALEPAQPAFAVEVSQALRRHADAVRAQVVR
jgi:nicotinate phosphoribosyltransferase